MEALLQNRLILALLSGIVGIFVCVLTGLVVNKRSSFTYFVRHNRVGVSTDDALFGTVRVTWKDNPVATLYSSTVELKNESLKDFENVVVRVYTHDTSLLTERTEIVGTTTVLEWTEAFSQIFHVAPGTEPTVAQRNLFNGQREYLIPTLNRDESVRLTFLNVPRTEKVPTLGLDVIHKGVKLKFRIPHEEYMGVPQPTAVLVGCLSGLVFVGIVIALAKTVWVAAIVSFLYGVLVLIPGALSIKLWRWLRGLVGG